MKHLIYSKKCLKKDLNAELLHNKLSITNFCQNPSKRRWRSNSQKYHSPITYSRKETSRQWKLHLHSKIKMFTWLFGKRTPALHWAERPKKWTVSTLKETTNKTSQESFQWKKPFQTCPKTQDQEAKTSKIEWLMKLMSVNDPLKDSLVLSKQKTKI